MKQQIRVGTINMCVPQDSLGLVEVHDAVDNLHRGVPTEEGDLVRQLLGGGVGSNACCFTAVL